MSERDTTSAGTVPFVGREAELQRLKLAVAAAADGRGRVVLIGGEPGIGKTRLIEELLDDGALPVARVLWGRCWEPDFAPPPFWPWIEALEPLGTSEALTAITTSTTGGADLAPLFPRAGLPARDEADSESARFRTLEAATGFLSAVARSDGGTGPARRALVVVLDDLHWADASSLLLVQFLARAIGGLPLLVIGLHHDTSPAREHPLSIALASLRRQANVETFALEGLTEEAVAKLLETSGTSADRARVLARTLRDRTEGNPFFLRELLAQASEVPAQGPADPRDVGASEVPASILEAVERRLDHLAAGTRSVLATASVLGIQFDARELDELTELSEAAFDAALQDAERVDLIRATGSSRYEFTHPLVRDALYASMPTRRRVRLHGRVADYLLRAHGEDGRASAELAYHYYRAGQAAEAFEAGLAAARTAESAAGWDEAARQYERCLELVGDARRERSEEGLLLRDLGRCLRLANAPRDAWGRLQSAMTVFEELRDGVEAAQTALEALRIPSPPGSREALVQRAIAALRGAHPELEVQLLLQRAAWSPPDGDGLASLERASALAEQLGIDDLEPIFSYVEGNRALERGDLDSARSQLRALHEASMAVGRSGWALNFLVSGNTIPLFEGRLAVGVAETRAAAEFAHTLYNRLREAGLLTWISGTHLALGDRDGADTWLARATAANPANFGGKWLRAVRAERAGDLERARSEMPAAGEAAGVPGWLAVVHGARARILFHAGDEDRARAELAQWWRNWSPFRLADGTPGYIHTMSCVDAVLPALGDERSVRAIYDELLRWSWARFSPANAVGVDQLRGALALRLDLVEDADRHYTAGLDWAEREHLAVEAGRCLLGQAAVLIRRGQPRAAEARIERASAVFRREGTRLYEREAEDLANSLAGHEPTPGATSEAELPDGLSRRELEVIRLIARGKTNQEIAIELTISPNTVARHITHIFTKTGSANRAEAASYGFRHHLI
ncbi:MAG: AAA family ATPase [Dehalococcoidia bacterium]|nr:AAA family ATPase [Dehalococcoidia bacterium]